MWNFAYGDGAMVIYPFTERAEIRHDTIVASKEITISEWGIPADSIEIRGALGDECRDYFNPTG